MTQNPLLQGAQLLARLEPELVASALARACWYASSASAWRPER